VSAPGSPSPTKHQLVRATSLFTARQPRERSSRLLYLTVG
jgi:hypothetical protein